MQERLECGKLEEKMKDISKEISCGCVTVDDQLSSDVDLLMEQKISHASPYVTILERTDETFQSVNKALSSNGHSLLPAHGIKVRLNV